jgi:hypothetical protein
MEGKNKSSFFPKFHYKKSSLHFTAVLGADCIHKNTDLIHDLFGLKWGFNHSFSIVWGYYYGKLHIGGRVKKNGFEHVFKIDAVEPNEDIKFRLYFDRISGVVSFIFKHKGKVYESGAIFDFTGCPNWGTYITPQISEKTTAPHKMTFFITK